jgi:cellobiose phosphorylase
MDFEVMRAVLFNPGTKENAGIFSHPQSWGVMAECILGNGDRAMQYHKAYLPSAQNEVAEIRGIEPYVHCQSTHGKHSKKFGRSRLPWLTGAATWTYHSATQYILGIRPEAAGLNIEPCIPKSWDGFTATRVFRGNKLTINVTNPSHVCKGVKSTTVDGKVTESSVIPVDILKDGSVIDVVMG